MAELCKKVSESKLFNNFILFVIGLAALVVGMQTYKNFEAQHHVTLNALDSIILGIFILEVLVKIVAQGRDPLNYFKDSWNIFDFSIVVVCILPIESNDFVAVLRLARVLRVLKLVSALPRLQVLVGAVLKSVPSIGYVFLLATIHFYIYGCMATFLYSDNDPVHFRNLQTSMLSLFRAVTLEDWTDLMYINMYGSANYGYDESSYTMLAELGFTRDQIKSNSSPFGAAIFFVSFVITGAMIVLNLFVGVMLTGMEDAKKEQELETRLKKEDPQQINLKDEFSKLNQDLQHFTVEMSNRLEVLNKLAEQQNRNNNPM
ncbi:MAG: potassium transporter [Verrucomicrobiales bacterium]|nr:potassium transporter [Verrucomicrobiales bacterium]|tara:strand:- start:347 stop:1297 length:951 start_codon:yes stop_codon:yes gene_type:complete